MMRLLVTMVTLWALALQGCAADERVGLTLLFLNMGHDSIGVTRFDVDGRRLGGPGALGGGANVKDYESRSGAQMSYMPERGKGPAIPEVVEIAWTVATPAIEEARRLRDLSFKDYSPQWMVETDRINKMSPRYVQRINLQPLLTPKLIEQVKSDRHGTQLKLLIKFNQNKVEIKATAEKWR